METALRTAGSGGFRGPGRSESAEFQRHLHPADDHEDALLLTHGEGGPDRGFMPDNWQSPLRSRRLGPRVYSPCRNRPCRRPMSRKARQQLRVGYLAAAEEFQCLGGGMVERCHSHVVAGDTATRGAQEEQQDRFWRTRGEIKNSIASSCRSAGAKEISFRSAIRPKRLPISPSRSEVALTPRAKYPKPRHISTKWLALRAQDRGKNNLWAFRVENAGSDKGNNVAIPLIELTVCFNFAD